MSPRLKTITRSILSILFAGVFLYLAFRNVRLGDLWNSLKEVHYGWVLVFVVVSLLSHMVRAVRWKIFLNPLKADTSYRNLFSAVMIGYMVNNILPRVGELVRPYVIGKLEGISKSSALGTVVVERIIETGSFFFILCAVLSFAPGSISDFSKDAADLRPLFLAGSAVSVVVMLWLFLKSESLFRFVRLLKPLVPRRFADRADHVIDAFLTGFRVSRAREHFAMIALLSLAIWGLYALGLYVAFFAYDPLVARGLGFGQAVILLTVTSFAFVMPAPGAFGTYHSFLMLAMMKLYGVDSVTALSFSVVTHEMGYLLVMTCGLYFFFKDHIRVRELKMGTAGGGVA
jgi:uncharacterized protein (TIRG00374 family)